MTREEYIVDVKTRFGDQRSKSGTLIRDMDDEELLTKMLDRYPGDREKIVDLDEMEEASLTEYPKSDIQKKLNEAKKGLFARIGDRFTERVDTASDEIIEDQNPLRKGLRVLGQGAGFVGDIASETINTIPGAETAIQKTGEALSETLPAQLAGKAYGKFKESNPELAEDVEDIAGVASIVPGAKILAKGITKTPDAARAVAQKGEEVVDAYKKYRTESNLKAVDDAVGRIVQGKPEDIEQAKRALKDIDTEGIDTYEELNERIGERVEALATKLDTMLQTEAPKSLTRDQLANRINVNGKTVMHSPVEDALSELGTYYSKINDVVNAEKVRQLTEKLNGEGLTIKEVNDIARLHGRDLNAFNASGELASGLSKQAAENTRKGLKTVVRDRLDGDTAKELDKQISDLLQTSDLTKKMEENVNKLYQKIKNRTLMQKAGGVVADIVDFASLGTLRGFIQKLLPSNVGLKTANALDLEKELKKNLERIKKMVDMEEGAEFDAAVKDLLKQSER